MIIISDEEKKKRQIEQIIDVLFVDDATENEKETIRRWLVGEEREQVKSEALQKKFFEQYRYGETSSYASEMWPELARRLNFDVGLNEDLVVKASRKPLHKRLSFIAAAVLTPLFVAGVALSLLVRNAPDSAPMEVAFYVPETTVFVYADEATTIILADGSTVELKENTVLHYASDFAENRMVTLADGEAFFSVAKDEEHPFSVTVNDVTITVLGTEFNVKAYENQADYEISLIAGSVAVALPEQIVTLEPLQSLKIDKEEHIVEVKEIGEGDIMRMRGLALNFDGATLDEMFKQVGQYFGVEVMVIGQIDLSEVSYMSFDEDATVEDVLNIMKLTQPKFNYTLDRDTLYILPI